MEQVPPTNNFKEIKFYKEEGLENSQSDRSSNKPRSAGSNEQFEKYTCEIYDGLKNYQSEEQDFNKNEDIHEGQNHKAIFEKKYSNLAQHSNSHPFINKKEWTNQEDEEIFRKYDP